MQLKSGYKQTEVGIIPEDWDVRPLKKISPSQSVGLVINPSSYFDERGTVPMLVGSNITANRIHWESAQRISDTSNMAIAASRLAARDLITVRVGEPGVTAVVPPELDGCNCASVMIVRQHQTFDSHWLCYVMNSTMGLEQVKHVQYGTAQKQFNISDAVDFLFPVPPIAEQEAIAGALSDADALIESLEQLLVKKRQLKQAAMQQLLTGKTRLPGFNDAWRSCTVGDLGHFSKGRGIKREEVSDDGLGCIRSGELYTQYRNYVITPVSQIPLAVARTALEISPGDLLFAGSGETSEEIGRCAAYLGEGEAYAGGDIVVLTPLGQNSMYLAHLMNHETVARQKARLGQGDAVDHINARNLAQIEIEIPPMEKQNSIAAVLSDMDAEIVALERRRDKSNAIKQGMMQSLLTGRVRLVTPKTTATALQEARA